MKLANLEFKVGLFSVISIVIIFFMLYFINPYLFKKNNMKNYYTILENAAGVKKETQIKTNGIIIGKVKSINLQINNVKINMHIEKDIKIPIGSKVEIKTKGMLGDVFIEIKRAKNSNKFIEDNSLIPASTDQDIMQLAESVGYDVKDMMKFIFKILSSNENNIKNITKNINSITDNLKLIIDNNEKSLTNVLKRLNSTTAVFNNLIVNNEKTVQATLISLRESSKYIKKTFQSINNSINDKNKIKDILDKLSKSLDNIDKAFDNIVSITKKINEGKGLASKMIEDDFDMKEVKSTIKKTNSILSDMDNLSLNMDIYAMTNSVGEFDGILNLKITPNDKNYILFGISNNLDHLNLQYLTRFNMFGFRVGLFESHFGLASDLYFWKDRLSLSFELYKSDDKIRRFLYLNSYVSVYFDKFNTFFITGLNDITNNNFNLKDNLFFGLGLRFKAF